MRHGLPNRILLALVPLAAAAVVVAQGNRECIAQESIPEVEAFEQRANASNPPGKILDAIGVKPGMVVGEVGARHGRIALPLARRVGPGGRVYANDIDAKALALLRARAEKEHLANLDTIVGRVDDPLFPKGSLDLAVMVWTYHELSQPAALLKNLAAALKPGARVALVEPRVVTRASVEADAGPAGLELIDVLGGVVARDDVFILRKK